MKRVIVNIVMFIMRLLLRNRFIQKVLRVVFAHEKMKNDLAPILTRGKPNEIQEITPITTVKSNEKKIRINIVVPTLEKRAVYGGIATALDVFFEMKRQLGSDAYDYRIILSESASVDKPYKDFNSLGFFIAAGEDETVSQSIVPVGARKLQKLSVRENDIFIATAWWTAFVMHDIIVRYSLKFPLVYLIQDFEPCFYPWSSRYALAEETYKFNDIKTIALFNTSILKDYFTDKGYAFYQAFSFEPGMNADLMRYLKILPVVQRKKQVLIYGRPSVDRNLMPIIVLALKQLYVSRDIDDGWEYISAGEYHPPIEIAKGKFIKPLGKLSLEEYAKVMKETSIGISLMLSPHPSYPPLEMACFGIRTITNKYANKDLSRFSKKISSIDIVTPQALCFILLRFFEEDVVRCKPDELEFPSVTFSSDITNVSNLINKLFSGKNRK